MSISCSCGRAYLRFRANFSQAENESLLYTGDFKLRRGKSAEATEWTCADTLIMETTFGRPRYRFPPTEQVVNQIVAFCREQSVMAGCPSCSGFVRQGAGILCALEGADLMPMLHGTVFK